MRRAREKSRHSGISLIEVAITLVVLALLIALGAPSFQTWLLNTQIRSSAEAMTAGLQLARGEAVRRNQAVQFTLVSTNNPAVLDDTCVLSAAGTSWVVSLDNPTSKCAAAPSSSVAPRIVAKKAGEGSAAATVAGTDASGNASSSVTFNGFGLTNGAANALTRINVTATASGTRSLRLQISSGGAVRLCDPVVTDTTDPRKC